MKIKVSVRQRCIYCTLTKRKNRIVNICKYKKHNQKQKY